MRSLGFAAPSQPNKNQRLWNTQQAAEDWIAHEARQNAGPAARSGSQRRRHRPTSRVYKRRDDGSERPKTPNARAHHLLRRDFWRRTPLGWAALNGYTTCCAAQLPESSVAGQPDSRVNLDRPAGPEPDNNSAHTPLGTARLAGDRLPPAFPIHQLRSPPGGGSLTARISCVAGEPRPHRPQARR